MRLAGKRALVIGGTAGIGRGIVEAFLNEGAQVVFTGRREALGQEMVAASGGAAMFRPLDVTDPEALRRAIGEVDAAFDGLEVLVNNAGVALDRTILTTEPEEFDLIFGTNVRFPFFATKWAAELMATRGGGSIVNIASTAGMRGLERRAAYCGSKGAVIQFSRAAALDLAASRVRVNCVSPGAVDTELIRRTKFEGQDDVETKMEALGAAQPLGRIGQPADIAQAVIFLASDESAWVTGSNIVVDGGLTAR
jgi:NAD(P)-dependent dehydrogenase (short-subunit alcohol dehydrogenase family)